MLKLVGDFKNILSKATASKGLELYEWVKWRSNIDVNILPWCDLLITIDWIPSIAAL